MADVGGGIWGDGMPVTGQLADTPTRGLPTCGLTTHRLDILWTGQLTD